MKKYCVGLLTLVLILMASLAWGQPGTYFITSCTEAELLATLGISGVSSVTLGPGTWPITANLIVPSGVKLLGVGDTTVIDSSAIQSEGHAIELGDYAELGNLKLSGALNAGTNNCYNQVNCGNYTYVHDYWGDKGGGIQYHNKANGVIERVRFTNSRALSGWSSQIHVSGTGAGNVVARDINIYNCDRGIENEDGATNCQYSDGYFEDVYVTGSYSFVLDAHTHPVAKKGANVSNISFTNFTLKNTEGISARGDVDTIASNIVFRNIVYDTPHLSTGRSLIDFWKSANCEVDGLSCLNANTTSVFGINGTGCVTKRVEIINARESRVGNHDATTEWTAEDITLQNTSSTGYTLRISYGSFAFATFTNLKILGHKGSGGLQIYGVTTPVTLVDPYIEGDSSTPGLFSLDALTGPIRIRGGKLIGASRYNVYFCTNDCDMTGAYLYSTHGNVRTGAGNTGIRIYQNEFAGNSNPVNDAANGSYIVYNIGGMNTPQANTQALLLLLLQN